MMSFLIVKALLIVIFIFEISTRISFLLKAPVLSLNSFIISTKLLDSVFPFWQYQHKLSQNEISYRRISNILFIILKRSGVKSYVENKHGSTLFRTEKRSGWRWAFAIPGGCKDWAMQTAEWAFWYYEWCRRLRKCTFLEWMHIG